MKQEIIVRYEVSMADIRSGIPLPLNAVFKFATVSLDSTTLILEVVASEKEETNEHT